jgi:hypothetical protein
MKTMSAVFLVGFVTLGSGAQKASAWWPWDAIFHNDCCPRICCKQYNAFSPFCCEGFNPVPGYGYGGSPACAFSDGQGYLGELPAPGTVAGPATNTPATPPANVGTAPNSSATAPGNAQVSQPGVPVRTWPAWGPGMMNPAGVPGFQPGFMNHGPASAISGPSYYPGFSGYGQANGFGRY